MNKIELRKIYLQKRKSITTKEKLIGDDLMLLQFQQLNFSNIQFVLSYWPLNSTNEPNTHLFTGYLKHLYPNINIAYPVTNTNNHTMQAILTHEHTTFVANQWGIYEPTDGYLLPPHQIDLIFVPLIIFDILGYRVGYGKGFYDKFLTKCHKNVVTIGFSYFEPITKISDTQSFDVPLNYCITPQNRYEF